MSTPLGRNTLQRLLIFASESIGWFTEAIPELTRRVVDGYNRRNEITTGGIVTEGAALAAGVLALSVTALESVINGRVKAANAADSNVDYLVAAGTVGQPIFADGADASALLLTTDQTAYVTLIQTNSDGAGGADDADNGACVVVAVIAGTASTYAAQTAHLSSQAIQDALDLSTGVHAGVTGWAHLAQILFDENSGAPTTTIVMNRNNVVSAV